MLFVKEYYCHIKNYLIKVMSEILIITSGSSQLLTQIATLQLKKIETNDVSVLYNGLLRGSLETFFEQVSKTLGFNYVGQINFSINPEKAERNQTAISIIKKENKKLNKIIDKKFNILKKFKNYDLILIPVRVKVFSDIMLLNYLKPKKVIYTADGIVDELPKRNFKGLKFAYLKNHLKSLPIKDAIYSPEFLKKDIKELGVYKEVELKAVISNLSKINLVKGFKELYLKENVTYVIISQHYHLHENVSFENDLSYYKNMILKASNKLNKNSVILFKPHPRDLKEKINEIENFNLKNLKVVSDEFQAVPIEFFETEFLKMKTIFLGGNSSATLFLKKTNKVISLFSEKYLSKELNGRIKTFAKKYEVNILEI